MRARSRTLFTIGSVATLLLNSLPVPAQCPPNVVAPTNFCCFLDGSATSIQLVWITPPGTFDSILIRRFDPSPEQWVLPASPNLISFDDDSVQPGVDHTYRIAYICGPPTGIVLDSSNSVACRTTDFTPLLEEPCSKGGQNDQCPSWSLDDPFQGPHDYFISIDTGSGPQCFFVPFDDPMNLIDFDPVTGVYSFNSPVPLGQDNVECCVVIPCQDGAPPPYTEIPTSGTSRKVCCEVLGGTAFIRGDYDANGSFNGLVDGLGILNFFFVPGSAPSPCESAADADANGVLNGLQDGLAMINVAFIPGTPPLPPPFPDCGIADIPLGCENPPPCP